ncbi:carbohydrate ABC transporter permease [Vallitalea maricola]|uniref:Sugar ABC transporter permease n=1 Tax=Vallitalea maricola TaxID=3074433 RepID=A0ACB5UP14_9FIRM|nr:sugar ABC transporter permease [Vallitalea sp. AN17-2]
MQNPKTIQAKSKIFLFLVPALVIYVIFLILPMIGAFYFSTTDWKGIKGVAIEFVGLKNYISAFNNPAFILSLKNMARMVFFSVLFHTPIALLLAVAINTKLKGYRFFKTIFFVPTIFPLTSIGLLWYFIFMPNGSMNKFLTVIGLQNLASNWLINPSTAINTIIFVNIWTGIGYYMVILLAGLTTIPEDVYEAAAIDGAKSFRKLFSITIPMLKPIITMCILMDIIGTVKVFDLIFVMTEGGPNGLTNLPTTLMYYEAFRYDNYGVGSAIGVIILIIALVLTLGSQYLMNRKEKVNG